MITFCGGTIVLIFVALFGVAALTREQFRQVWTDTETFYDATLRGRELGKTLQGLHDSNKYEKYCESIRTSGSSRPMQSWDCDPKKN